METPKTPTPAPASNETIKETLSAHLPKEEHGELWEKLHAQLGVSDTTPIDLKALWEIKL